MKLVSIYEILYVLYYKNIDRTWFMYKNGDNSSKIWSVMLWGARHLPILTHLDQSDISLFVHNNNNLHTISNDWINNYNCTFIKTVLVILFTKYYSRNVLRPLNLISTFLLLSIGQYLCWWDISPLGYHPPSSQCFGMVY